MQELSVILDVRRQFSLKFEAKTYVKVPSVQRNRIGRVSKNYRNANQVLKIIVDFFLQSVEQGY